jgi:competence protein ComEC
MAGFYVGLALLVVFPRIRWRHYVQLAGVWVAIGLAMRGGQHREGHFECTFLSVGHGTSVILRTPEGQTILYDAGQLGSPAGGARSIGGTLWAQGIMRLDAVVISHADIDHYNALPALLQQFQVDTIYVSPLMFREEIEPLEVLRDAIDASGATLCELSAGDRLSFGQATVMTVLHPPAEGVYGSDNAQSIVLAVECHGRRVLLPGDLEAPGTQALLAQPAWDVDVLLAPHHGSLRSNPPGVSHWCRPEWVVISGSHSNDRAGGVRAAYEAVDARVFHTAYDGAVRFRLTTDGVSAAHWHDGGWAACEPKR